MHKDDSTTATGNPPAETDTADRMVVVDAVDVIADLTRAGLPLVSWNIHPHHHGRVEITGHAGSVRGGATSDEVRDTVRSYGEHFGVEACERIGKRQDSIHALGEVNGVRVDVWGATAIHDDEDGAA